MENLVEYLIPYKGLSMGKHDYQFHVTNTFFRAVKSELIENGDLKVEIVLDKQSRLMLADLKIEGYIELICDRCLEPFHFEIDLQYEQIYKYGPAPDQQDDDIIYLQDSEYQIDTSLLILENLILSLPIKKVHPDDSNGKPSCNHVQLNMIKNYVKKKQADPRWDVLKDLKFDD